ncbi:MAG: DUF1801 domain-containing protein [Bacteroidota bacterium]|nr:DUF1801 domain-containing protein [Bacteroidota bacterium]
MKKNDNRIDAYIAKSQPFAQPILFHIRELVHTACPDVEETIKWGFPHFDYRGEMMCSMAAFKQHCAFGFWKASLMNDKDLILNARSETSMGHFGKITSLDDLPSDKRMIAYIKEAAKLNADGVKIKKPPVSKDKKKLIIPNSFLSAVKKNERAFAVFNAFSYSNKKEYVEWITEAKTEKTRISRLETAVKWMEEEKARNWKYLKK